jgi:hypothetical protein
MKYPSTERNSQRGVYIVLSPILLLVLLSVAALAFDSLNLILARYRLMRAVDNSILSSPMLLIGSRDLTSAQVKEALEKKLKAQISLNYPLSDLSFNVEVPDLGTARISARLSRRLFLAPVVFNSNTSSDVFFDSEVIVPRVNAVVAIDCSWSMSRIDSLNPGQLKIGTALAAANYVLEYLRESYDRVSLVIFDQEATVVIPFTPNPGGGFNAQDIKSAGLSKLSLCDSWSDISDGLKVSSGQIDNLKNVMASDLSDELNLVLLLTDGLTSHAKFKFPNAIASSGIQNNREYHAFITNYAEDLLTTGVFRVSGYALRAAPLNSSVVGISDGYSDLKPACETNTGYPASVPPDHSTCFTNGFSFTTPDGNIIGPASNVSGKTAHEMMFLQAIITADDIRSSTNALLYALAISDPASAESSRFAEDTLGLGLNKEESIDTFMRRLTIPPESAADPDFNYVPSATVAYNDNKSLSGDTFRIKTHVEAKRGTRSALAALWYRKLR